MPGGGLAQLGEYLHGMQGVTGSIPVSSTILFFPYSSACAVYHPFFHFTHITSQNFSVVFSYQFLHLGYRKVPEILLFLRLRYDTLGWEQE